MAAGLGVMLSMGAPSAVVSAATPAADLLTTKSPSAAAVVASAQQYLGYPYAYVGDTPTTGFSCIGFVHYIFGLNGIDVPGNLADAYASAPVVAQSSLQPGDLVFFQNTVWAGISHVDIYVGGGKMIGADSFQTGVQMDTLSDAYWQQHYLGSNRPLSSSSGAATGAPAQQSSATPAPFTPPGAATATPTLLTPSTPAPTAAAIPAPTTSMTVSTPEGAVGAVVTTLQATGVYGGPGATFPLIDHIAAATTATLVQVQGTWLNIVYAGGTRAGWIDGSTDQTNAQPGARPSGSTSSRFRTQGRRGSVPGATTTPSPTATTTTTPAPTLTTATPASLTNDAGQVMFVQSITTTVQADPSGDGPIVSILREGTGVTVLQLQGQWVQAALDDGTLGWIDRRDLSQNPTSSSPAAALTRSTPSSTGAIAIVTAPVLLERSSPSRGARVLRRLTNGTRVTILGSRGHWDKVRQADGSRGWVSARWLSVAPN